MNAVRMRRILPATLLVLLALSTSAPAEPAKAVWDPARTTSPESVEELRALETRVKQVVEKSMPATVGLLVGNGAGSGVIVSEDGLVLTAAHVIGKPDASIRIVLSNGSVVKGKSLGLNSKVDSGMVQITDPPPKGAAWPGASEGKWPAVNVGKSESLKKGQWVVALGHPGGPKRERPPPVRVGRFDKYSHSESYIRSDCTLVGGDSGGPLFDLNGDVVGIHSRIGVFLEFNMHVPTEEFKKDWDKLVRGDVIGKPSNVEIGIVLDEDEEQPTVKEVVKDGPAEKAGFKPGDVILKFKGEQVEQAEDLAQLLRAGRAGQEVTVDVRRGDETVTLKVTLARKKR